MIKIIVNQKVQHQAIFSVYELPQPALELDAFFTVKDIYHVVCPVLLVFFLFRLLSHYTK